LNVSDHFLYSHHLNVRTSIDYVTRNFIVITVRAGEGGRGKGAKLECQLLGML